MCITFIYDFNTINCHIGLHIYITIFTIKNICCFVDQIDGSWKNRMTRSTKWQLMTPARLPRRHYHCHHLFHCQILEPTQVSPSVPSPVLPRVPLDAPPVVPPQVPPPVPPPVPLSVSPLVPLAAPLQVPPPCSTRIALNKSNCLSLHLHVSL